jgi:transcriptional regulator with XRE-family HTH domain
VTKGTHRRRKVDVAEVPTHEEFVAKVGEAIRRERLARGWTQVELADQVGISSNHIARLERGEVGPTFYLMHRIGASLGIDLSTLSGTRRTA